MYLRAASFFLICGRRSSILLIGEVIGLSVIHLSAIPRNPLTASIAEIYSLSTINSDIIKVIDAKIWKMPTHTVFEVYHFFIYAPTITRAAHAPSGIALFPSKTAVPCSPHESVHELRIRTPNLPGEVSTKSIAETE